VATKAADKQIVGKGKYTYERDVEWGRRAGGVPQFGVAQGLHGDSKDRVYVFVRSPAPEMLVFDRDGKLLNSWGFGRFKHPHGVWFNDRDELFLTDRDTHLVTQWTLDGTFVREWGQRNEPGAPGAPFNQPTKAFQTRDGELYVSDGYGQHRVHRFAKDGTLIRSWGEKGTGPSQFALPHDVVVDSRDRVLLCDRENGRVQVFDREGNYQSEWADLKNPMQIHERDGVFYVAQSRRAVEVRDLDFKELSSWEYQSVTPRAENSPHSIWADSRGDIYIGEVTGEDGLQKFTRQ
jgi:DNA-binding beta-propeller fold protein YncE